MKPRRTAAHKPESRASAANSWAALAIAADQPDALRDLARSAALLERGDPLPQPFAQLLARAFRAILNAAQQGEELPSLNLLLNFPAAGAVQRAYRDGLIRSLAQSMPGATDSERGEVLRYVVASDATRWRGRPLPSVADPVVQGKIIRLRRGLKAPKSWRRIFTILRGASDSEDVEQSD